MTRKLRPSERADERLPLTAKMLNFIRRALSKGASPKTVAEAAERARGQTRKELRNESAPWVRRLTNAKGEHYETWEELSGTRHVDLKDVRRVYDSMRKSKKWAAADENRKQNLALYREEEERKRIDEAFLRSQGIQPRREPTRRELHDLAYARHFGASREDLTEMAAEMGLAASDIPSYLLGE